MKAITRLLRSSSIPVVLLFISSPLTAQVTIKERIEIQPSTIARPQASVNPLMVSLDPINSADLVLDNCGGYLESVDDIYDDRIFVPRVGGVIGIAYAYRYNYERQVGSWEPQKDTL